MSRNQRSGGLAVQTWFRAVFASTVLLTAIIVSYPAGAVSKKQAVAEARSVLLVRADFPTGWTTSANSDSGSIPGLGKMASCLNVPTKLLSYNPPGANSPTFNQNSLALSVADDVEVFPSATVATEQFNVWSSTKMPACLAAFFNSPAARKSLEQSIGAGAKVGTATVTFEASPHVGGKATAMLIEIPTSYRKVSLKISLSIVTIFTKAIGSQLTFTSAFGAFPSALQVNLEDVAAQKL
jgi:hypothetical protein